MIPLRYASHWIDFGAAGQKLATVGFDQDNAVRSVVVRMGSIVIDVVGDLSPGEITTLQEEQAVRDSDPQNRADFLYDGRRAA